MWPDATKDFALISCFWSVEFDDNAGSLQIVAMCRDCAHSAGGIREFQTAPLHRIYGRAEPGERVFDKVPGDHGKNVSTIGPLVLMAFVPA